MTTYGIGEELDAEECDDVDLVAQKDDVNVVIVADCATMATYRNGEEFDVK